jgi:hypothetical protein
MTKSYVFLTQQALQELDDFVTDQQVFEKVDKEENMTLLLVRKCLVYLKSRHCCDTLLHNEKVYWFPTPGYDDRIKILEERARETSRRGKKKTGRFIK